MERPRRFLPSVCAIAVCGAAILVPVAIGMAVFLDPLRRDDGQANTALVAALSAVPDDGIPREFTVLGSRHDAWMVHPPHPVGRVFLRRQPVQRDVQALNATCPHAGCAIEYEPSASLFRCWCHHHTFELTGKRTAANDMSPRDMDSLVSRLAGDEIWVEFHNFQIATPKKIVRR